MLSLPTSSSRTVTSLSRLSDAQRASPATGISLGATSGREFPRWRLRASEHTLGLKVAASVGVVTSDQRSYPHARAAGLNGADIMARSVSITRSRKRQPKHHEEQRPVLQLPLERPDWRDPVERDQAEPERERGVALIDFYI
jgi:hypothetical protein